MRLAIAPPILFACALAVAVACASPSSRIAYLYTQLEQDAATSDPGAPPDMALLKRREERAKKAREIAAAHGLKGAADHLKASVILVETDDAGDLKLAEDLALEAAREGEPLGFRVAAEAADKVLVKRGLPQRYGTQYEWVPVIKAWRLYPVDARTSDAERRAMGVPPLAELYQGEERLNQTSNPKPK